MTEAEWLGDDLDTMLDFLPVREFRRIRLFSCACCRRIWQLLSDERSQRAVEVAELFADGLATADALATSVVDASGVGGWEAAEAAAKCACEDRFGVVNAPGLAAAAVAKGTEKGARFRPRRAETARAETAAQCHLLRDIFGNPFRPVGFAPEWRTEDAVGLARGMYDAHGFDRMAALAAALENAGCTNPNVLNHCRSPGPHVRGCWVVDLVLGKE